MWYATSTFFEDIVMTRKRLVMPDRDKDIINKIKDIELGELVRRLESVPRNTIFLPDDISENKLFDVNINDNLSLRDLVKLGYNLTSTAISRGVDAESLILDIIWSLEIIDEDEANKIKEKLLVLFGHMYQSILAYKTLSMGGENFYGIDAVINERPVIDDDGDLLGYVIATTISINHGSGDKESVTNFLLDYRDLEEIRSKLDDILRKREFLINRYKNAKAPYFGFSEEIK